MILLPALMMDDIELSVDELRHAVLEWLKKAAMRTCFGDQGSEALKLKN